MTSRHTARVFAFTLFEGSLIKPFAIARHASKLCSIGFALVALAIPVSINASEAESYDVVADVKGDEIDKKLVRRLYAPFADWLDRCSLRPMDVYEDRLVRQTGKDPLIKRMRSRLIISEDSSRFLFTRMMNDDFASQSKAGEAAERINQAARPSQMLSLIAEGPSAMFLDAGVDTTWRSRGTENGMKRVKARDFRNLPLMGASNLHFTFGKPMAPSSRLDRLPTRVEFHVDGSVTAIYDSKKSKTSSKVFFSSTHGMLPVRMSSHLLNFDEETKQFKEGNEFGSSVSKWERTSGEWILAGASLRYHTPRAPANQRTSLIYEVDVKMRPKVNWADISPTAPLPLLTPEVWKPESNAENNNDKD